MREQRTKQIMAAADKEFESLSEASAAIAKIIFLIGAEWADQKQISNKKETRAWEEMALRENEGPDDPMSKLIFQATLLKGVKWAIENPEAPESKTKAKDDKVPFAEIIDDTKMMVWYPMSDKRWLGHSPKRTIFWDLTDSLIRVRK
ncbi:MAG: hypothetical protein NC248_12310 [Bacteroides sp.]|nr:hypothetical protein [Bacteroides sp.]MCM1391111.1 hypothetical protein [Bacteroides sp.]